jgi:excisionase family DNA binding protein
MHLPEALHGLRTQSTTRSLAIRGVECNEGVRQFADDSALLLEIGAMVREVLEIQRGTVKPYYGVAEAAKLLGRKEYTVRSYIREGRLRAERLAGCGPKGRLLIPRDSLMSLIEGRCNPAKESVLAGIKSGMTVVEPTIAKDQGEAHDQ